MVASIDVIYPQHSFICKICFLVISGKALSDPEHPILPNRTYA